eukprot:3666556-Pleurochrysis_carterae.AAC.2
MQQQNSRHASQILMTRDKEMQNRLQGCFEIKGHLDAVRCCAGAAYCRRTSAKYVGIQLLIERVPKLKTMCAAKSTSTEGCMSSRKAGSAVVSAVAPPFATSSTLRKSFRSSAEANRHVSGLFAATSIHVTAYAMHVSPTIR